MKSKARISTVAAIASAIMLVLAPEAQANWTSSINNGGYGFESRRWDDQSYSQIQFTNCYVSWTSPPDQSVVVQMWRDISFQPDDSYDRKTFTACFGGGTSNGEWTDLPSSTVSVYFELMEVGGRAYAGGPTVDVSTVYVDTTLAD